MIIRRGATLIASMLVGGLALVGCGGDDSDGVAQSETPAQSESPAANGVEELSASEILDKAKAAATAADSVHISGEVVEDGSTINIDMQYGNDGSTGSITVDGATVDLLRVGTDYYMKAGADTWEQLTGEAAAGELLADRYVKIPSDEESLAQLTSFLDLEAFMEGALDPTGEIEKGETSEVNGVQAIGIIDNDPDDGGTLYVALTGEPYPLRIEAVDSSDGSVDFVDWGEPVEIAAPADEDVIDLSDLN